MEYSEAVCKVCSKVFRIKTYRLNHGRGKTCSVECRRIYQKQFVTGSSSVVWRGGIHLSEGYRYIKMNGHHLANKAGYVSEHRLILEQKIGRRLLKGEVAHHINGVRYDNRPANLEVMDEGQHHSHHNKGIKATPERKVRMREAWIKRKSNHI